MLVEATNVVPDLQMLLRVPDYVTQLLKVVQCCQSLREKLKRLLIVLALLKEFRLLNAGLKLKKKNFIC
jgi:hypothetical protein